MEFQPILILAVLWLLILLPLSKLSQAKKQQAAAKNANSKARQAEAQNAPAAPAGPDPAAEPAEPRVLRPSITFTAHDDSVYQGSMNAVTGEGYDPCHNEQLAPLTALETAPPAAEETVPGLRLSWTGSDVGRGLVMSEVLKRK